MAGERRNGGEGMGGREWRGEEEREWMRGGNRCRKLEEQLVAIMLRCGQRSHTLPFQECDDTALYSLFSFLPHIEFSKIAVYFFN